MLTVAGRHKTETGTEAYTQAVTITGAHRIQWQHRDWCPVAQYPTGSWRRWKRSVAHPKAGLVSKGERDEAMGQGSFCMLLQHSIRLE